MLRNSASALAGYAASDLLETNAAAGQAFGTDPFTMWRHWLTGRVEDLAAAVAVARPELFTAQIQWGRAVLEARGVAPACFRAGIECLQQVLTKELPDEAGDLVKPYVDAALGQFDGQAAEACCRLSPETLAGQLASRYLLAVLEGDRRKARETVLEVDPERISIPQIYLDVILPAQEEIGRMWLVNEITVAEEHFATSTTRSVMAQLLAKAPVGESHGKTVMTAAVAGNRHDIGIQAVCDFFEMDGWKAIQLGADVPIGDLVEAVGCFRADLLALSTTLVSHLPKLRETIAAVRNSDRGGRIKILVGGRAFGGCSDTAVRLGADAYAATAQEAVAVAASLFDLPHDPSLFSGK
jgi:methanogenic corrinoid protein MtbC1